MSFGQVSVAILRELYFRDMQPCLFLIGGNPDLSTQPQDQDFFSWIESCLKKAYSQHKRTDPVFKLWHLQNGIESVSNKQILLSFYELDSPTQEEINVVNNNSKVLLTSNYAVDIFKKIGCQNVDYISLGFDKFNFFPKEKKYFEDGRITFNLVGKLEKRKHHERVIKAWIKRFGGNKQYSLQCAIFNPFRPPEDQQRIFSELVGGRNDTNVNFLGFMPTNEIYNDFLNSGDIVIGMSGGEGFGLPEFQSIALGKHAVILNAHSYKDWANQENAALVQPSGKIDSVDNVFFAKGNPWNQGSIFDFKEDEFISACEVALQRHKENPINKAGQKLQSHNYKIVVDSILKHIESV